MKIKDHTFRELLYKVLGFFLFPFIRLRFNFTCDDLQKLKQPFLIVSNHNSDWDSIFITVSTRRVTYFVATERLTRMGIGGFFVRNLCKPIIHYKGMLGVKTVKEMLAHLKAGYNVGVYPEGNRSFNGRTNDFVATIGKLAQKSGATLVTYRLNGMYFTMPRWGKGIRRGRVRGKCVNTFTPEQLSKMSVDEINAAIRNDIFEDAYAVQAEKKIAYSGHDTAVGIESTLFACPKCGRIGGLSSAGNRVSCDCGFSALYDEYCYLRSDDGSVFTITELDAGNRELIESLSKRDGTELLFSDEENLEDIGPDHKLISRRRAKLSAYPDRLLVDDETVPFSAVEGMSIHGRNTLMFHFPGKHYELSGGPRFSALKYLYLYNAATKGIATV